MRHLLDEDGNLTPEAIKMMESRRKTAPKVNRLRMEAELGRSVTIAESHRNIFTRALAFYRRNFGDDDDRGPGPTPVEPLPPTGGSKELA